MKFSYLISFKLVPVFIIKTVVLFEFKAAGRSISPCRVLHVLLVSFPSNHAIFLQPNYVSVLHCLSEFNNFLNLSSSIELIFLIFIFMVNIVVLNLQFCPQLLLQVFQKIVL